MPNNIADLNPASPVVGDDAGDAYLELQNLKSALQESFTGFTNNANAIVTKTGPEIDAAVDAAAGIGSASESAEGLIEIATQNEVDTGVGANKTVTPVTLGAWSPSSFSVSGTMTAGAFSGLLTGNVTGDVTGTADNASAVDVLSASGTLRYPLMAGGDGTAKPVYRDDGLKYNPNTNELTVVGGVIADLTGDVTGTADNTKKANVRSATAGTRYLTMVGNTGTALDVEADGDLNYNTTTNTLTCPNFAGEASKAAALEVNTVAGGTRDVLLSFGTGAGRPVQRSANLQYDVTSNTLTVGKLNGEASEVKTVAMTGVNHYPVMTPNYAPGGYNLRSESGTYYNQPSKVWYATDFSTSSDVALKENFEPITGALDKLAKITGQLYDRKDSGERHSGVVAQDVQKVLPEAVSKMADGMLAVSPQRLLALVISAVNELAEKVDGG